MTPEKKVKDAIRAYLKGIGAYYFMPVQMGYGASTLDFLICYKGRFYGVEAKRDGGKPTPRQESVMQAIVDSGGSVCVENSPALSLLKEMLRS